MTFAFKNNDSTQSLIAYFHSVSDDERSHVIDMVLELSPQEATRELIQLFNDCEWRNTRMDIIHALSKKPTERGLEFLFTLARNEKDLPIAEAALSSIGLTQHRLSCEFLQNGYSIASEHLKPGYVAALAQIPDRTFLPQFIEDFKSAMRAGQFKWAKSLIFAFGELKSQEALILLEETIFQSAHPDLVLSALVAFGKVARKPELLVPFEKISRSDFLRSQVFQNAKTQVQFRSQWSIEDYLRKLFESPNAHRALPFELTHFKAAEVIEGFGLYSDSQYLERLAYALSKLDLDIDYSQLIAFKSLSDDQFAQVIESFFASDRVRARLKPIFSSALINRKDFIQNHFELYLRYSEDQQVAEYSKAIQFKTLTEMQQMNWVNEVYHRALCCQGNTKRLQPFQKALDETFSQTEHPGIQTRILRAYAALHLKSKNALEFCRVSIEKPGDHEKAIGSVLRYLEACPDKAGVEWLMQWVSRSDFQHLSHKGKAAFIRAVGAYESTQKKAEFIKFLNQSIKGDFDSEPQIEALRYLRMHSHPELVSQVEAALGDPHKKNSYNEIQLAAIITLKYCGSEQSADLLSPFLKSKIKALSGRALDTLTSLSGVRAKRIIIDLLKEKVIDSEYCDKVIRCLKTPETGAEYFVKCIDDIIEKHPEHVQMDGFVMLRERLSERKTASGSQTASKTIDVREMDVELSQKILGYSDFDESVKSALRSAEMPYRKRELFDEYVDKSSSILEYCKAVDLLLERSLGKRLLFPRLESRLSEFENALYSCGLSDDFSSAERVLQQLRLEGEFSVYSLPHHKMQMIAQAIRNGRIVNDQFKILDGLRAWAVMLLLFGRKVGELKPLIPLQAVTDAQMISFCKRLIALQEVRNPVAHRATEVKFTKLEEVRNEVFSLLSQHSKIFAK